VRGRVRLFSTAGYATLQKASQAVKLLAASRYWIGAGNFYGLQFLG
jgi:hypothetical protein